MTPDPTLTDFQKQVDKFNEVMAMDSDVVEQLAQKVVEQLAQKVRTLGTPDPTLTDEKLAEMVACPQCDVGPNGHCRVPGYGAVSVTHRPRLIAALRASREEIERLRGIVGQEVGG